MWPEQNQKAFDWIRMGCKEQGKNRPAILASRLIPPVFESYAKLLPCIRPRYEFIDNPLSPPENKILGIPSCEPLRSFVESKRNHPAGDRIRWRELAEFMGVPFVPAIQFAWFREKMDDPWCCSQLLLGATKAESQEECRALVSVLKSPHAQRECFFRFSDVAFYSPHLSTEAQLFKGVLDEVCDFQKKKRMNFVYWWPSDQSWCVCSDYDLEVTIIAGSKHLISALLHDPVLECIEVAPDTRVDYRTPMP